MPEGRDTERGQTGGRRRVLRTLLAPDVRGVRAGVLAAQQARGGRGAAAWRRPCAARRARGGGPRGAHATSGARRLLRHRLRGQARRLRRHERHVPRPRGQQGECPSCYCLSEWDADDCVCVNEWLGSACSTACG
ncbi:hypothetical protein PybrP1_002906 [[Pythium] brassicae (nom. inval.)]|nr:hypothetical protein PybrP1_002906 [[Pythium] brassicae (nom. inval.)]